MLKLLKSASVVASALICSACGSSNGLYPVTGKVLVKGEPAVGASVTFLRKGLADPYSDKTSQGVVTRDGTFHLAGPAGSGALPGDYVVLIEWKEGAGKTAGRSPGLNAPDRLKNKYLDPKKPLLTAKVEAKSNSLPPFELK